MREKKAERLREAVLELAHAVRCDGVERFKPRSPLECEAAEVAAVWRDTGGDLGAVRDALRCGVRRLSRREVFNE